MCFETAMTAAICEGGCERVAPDRSDNSHTMSARWLDRRTLQNPPADFPGGGRWNSTGTRESRGVSSRLDRPRIGCLPVAGSRRAAGAAGEAARRPRAGHSQPLLWCDAAGGRGAGGAYSSLLGRLAGLSSVAVAPDRGLACRAAGNWQKMAHASSTQASCRE